MAAKAIDPERGRGGARSMWAPLAFLAAILAVWWGVTAMGDIAPWALPTPGLVVQRLGTDVSAPWMWQAIGITFAEALLGSLLGAVVAFPLAFLICHVPLVGAAVEPFLGATQAIPAIALAPLLVLWIGYGTGPIVVLCALMVFFPILVTTTLGLRHLDRDILGAAALDGAGTWRLIWNIEIPLAAPAMLSGLRNGCALSVTGAVVGEMVMGGTGLGQVLTTQRNNLDTPGMFVTIAVLCALATALYGALLAVERRRRRAT